MFDKGMLETISVYIQSNVWSDMGGYMFEPSNKEVNYPLALAEIYIFRTN